MFDLYNLPARSVKGQPTSNWQSLGDHSLSVAKLARLFGRKFESSEICHILGKMHDFGKIHPNFQQKMLYQNGLSDTPPNGNSDHSSMGGSVVRKLNPFGLLLSYPLVAHHGGLNDYTSNTFKINKKEEYTTPLEDRLKDGDDKLDVFKFNIDTMRNHYDFDLSMVENMGPHKLHYWVRMIYSVLVDSDRLDAERFSSPDRHKLRGKYATIPELLKRFNDYTLNHKFEKNNLNDIRNNILDMCLKASKFNHGMFSLTVPTGGGKTLSSMAFALNHAVEFNKSRVVLIVPYTSIIEQTSAVFRNIFGDDNVVEHHSNVDYEDTSKRDYEDNVKLNMSCENWDAPIIITTNVQFFESILSNKASRCRKLHNIINSVCLFDEAQMIPPKLINVCSDILNCMVSDYKVTSVLMTATQPKIPGIKPPVEIVKDIANLYNTLKRVKFHFPTAADLMAEKTTPWMEVSDNIKKHKQVLCVVNTRKQCVELCHMVGGAMHLSALMCGKHRTKVIADIKRRLKSDEPCAVISTQLIEAGVDVDFPVVYRVMAGLDSIFQSAGRCNREGKLKFGDVYVFSFPPNPEEKKYLKNNDIERAANVTRRMIKLGLPLDDPKIFSKYFEFLYEQLDHSSEDKIYSHLTQNAESMQINFESAARLFKLIPDEDVPIIVPYMEGVDLIRELETCDIVPFQLTRRLQRFTVNLIKSKAKSNILSGNIKIIKESYHVWTGAYDDNFGMVVDL